MKLFGYTECHSASVSLPGFRIERHESFFVVSNVERRQSSSVNDVCDQRRLVRLIFHPHRSPLLGDANVQELAHLHPVPHDPRRLHRLYAIHLHTHGPRKFRVHDVRQVLPAQTLSRSIHLLGRVADRLRTGAQSRDDYLFPILNGRSLLHQSPIAGDLFLSAAASGYQSSHQEEKVG